jgi:ATP-dependent DNA helicase DinG
VIFDEAHDVEDVAGQYFGVSISSGQVEDLTRDVASLAHRKQFGSEELDRILITLNDRSAKFFGLFGTSTEGRTGFRAHEAFLEQNEEAYRDVLRALEMVTLQLELLKAPPDEAIPLVTRAREMARRLEFWMEGKKGVPDKRYVYWIERRGRRTFLQATPIEVSQLLDERLFDRVDTVIMTSATLAVADSFEYTLRRLGLRAARTELVPSHFDH